MKTEKASLVLLGYKFTRSYYFKVWQVLNKIKKITSPSYYSLYIKKSRKFSHFSPGWIKNIIIPSKAFKRWLKINAFNEKIVAYFIDLGKEYIPSPLKLIIKKYFPILFYRGFQNAPKKIELEWKKWIDNRDDKSVDILNFGVIAYNYRIQRPQHLAMEMTKLGNRVFYIENEFVFSPSAKQPNISVRSESTNLYTVKLSSSKNYFIYNNQASSKDRAILIESIKLLMKKARIVNPVAKIDHPFWASIAKELGMPIIYDIMDLHSGFKENSSENLEAEQDLIKSSNLVLTSSDLINRTFSKYNKNTITLRNAGEYEHFSTSKSFLKNFSKPVELKFIKGPVLGYYGALSDWFDVGIIEKLALDYPASTIVLIGLVNNQDLIELAKKYSNILLLGEKPYADLPQYLSCFDVCLIPFKLTPLIQATNPVKIYEYFASGKPVVATNIPELSPFKKITYLAKNKSDFSKLISKAINEKSDLLVKQRMATAKTNTWKMRALVLNSEIKKFYPKVSVVILTYNHADLSKISVDTTLDRSKYPNLEVIIVDNNSDAQTIKMLKNYVGKDRVKVIFNKVNHGFAKGNNIGMKKATGEFIILLNNDVRVTPGWVERLVFHAKDKKIGLVGPVTNSIGNESKISIGYDPENQKELEIQAANYTYSHWNQKLLLRNIAAFAWILSRDVYKKIGDLDERFGRGLFEDDDYCVRVEKAKLEIYCAEDSFVHHYGGASTGWGSPEYKKLFDENKLKFEEKWGFKWIPHKHRKNI